MSGWIKLHRSTTEWEWYSDHNTTRLFIHLLIKANHKDGKWQGAEIPRGSLITGVDSLRLQTGLTASQIRTSLKKLKKTGEIAIKTTNKYSIIEVKKWKEHQVDDKQVTNKSQTDDKQIATNKNDKKEKNNYDGFIERFNHVTGRNYRVLSDKVVGAINARLKEGFTLEDIFKAAKNAANSEYHRNNPKYLSPEFITRDTKLQMYLNDENDSHIFKSNERGPSGEDLCNGLTWKQHHDKYGEQK